MIAIMKIKTAMIITIITPVLRLEDVVGGLIEGVVEGLFMEDVYGVLLEGGVVGELIEGMVGGLFIGVVGWFEGCVVVGLFEGVVGGVGKGVVGMLLVGGLVALSFIVVLLFASLLVVRLSGLFMTHSVWFPFI